MQLWHLLKEAQKDTPTAHLSFLSPFAVLCLSLSACLIFFSSFLFCSFLFLFLLEGERVYYCLCCVWIVDGLLGIKSKLKAFFNLKREKRKQNLISKSHN